MNRRWKAMLSAACLCLCMSALARAADTPAELLQKGLLKESGERDLEGAVQLYKQVIEQPGADRLVVLQARLRMGSCYESLGKIPEAEDVYREILKSSTSPQSEVAQEAEANLERLEQQRALASSGTARSDQFKARREYQPTRASLSLGPLLLASGNQRLPKMAVALRYPVTSRDRPLASYLEARSILPVGNPEIQTIGQSQLRLNYQASIVLASELPHGSQRGAIPEIGAGLALTESTVSDSRKGVVSPTFVAGVRMWPDHIFSLAVEADYTASPYKANGVITDPPSSIWTLGAKLVLKLGWPRIVIRPIK